MGEGGSVDITVTDGSDIATVVKTISGHVTTSLDGLTDGLIAASAAIIPFGMTLFAIKFVPRWGMSLFKAVH